MKTFSMLLAAAMLALAGCGDAPDERAASSPAPKDDTPAKEDGAAAKSDEGAPKKDAAAGRRAARGTTITVGDSQFGSMLFDARKQAIYIFQRDPEGRSVCYGDCAEAWPPVLTKGRPRAGEGTKASLLGSVRRRDGKLQVTYAGKPLYFYAHEGPGQVLCHNVDLNGGLWWVVGPDGRRRP